MNYLRGVFFYISTHCFQFIQTDRLELKRFLKGFEKKMRYPSQRIPHPHFFDFLIQTSQFFFQNGDFL